MNFRLTRLRSWEKIFVVAVGLVALCAWVYPSAAQEAVDKRARRAAFLASMPDPMSDDTTGFEPIFDGKTLKGWDGDPDFWRAEGGSIVGESTAEKPVKVNTFLIWRGGHPADFELRLDYRINSTNSGIQYRSVELPDVGKWVLRGYQADIDIDNRFTGQVYEERGRGFLALRGQLTRLAPGTKAVVQGQIGDADALKSKINTGWNTLRISARGNVLTQVLNGQVMSVVIDDDVEKRMMQGLLGIQLHVGPPMGIHRAHR